MEDLEIILFFDCDGEKWVNPDIESICKFDDHGVDRDVIRIMIDSEQGRVLHGVVKSEFLSKIWTTNDGVSRLPTIEEHLTAIELISDAVDEIVSEHPEYPALRVSYEQNACAVKINHEYLYVS